jgi:hypothetical protein
MLKRIITISFCLITILSLLIMVPGCTKATPSSLPEPSYAKSITENVLLALNNNDFTRYTADFDQTMKQAFSQSAFNQVKSTIASKVGSYAAGSLEFTQAVTQDNYTVVVYSAKFSNEPENVIVTISFQNVDGKNLVGGLYFNSPKLRS